jgi:hypothetical protein
MRDAPGGFNPPLSWVSVGFFPLIVYEALDVGSSWFFASSANQ